MKKILFILWFIVISIYIDGQVCTAVISPAGSTTFCKGDSVLLNANMGNTWSQIANFGDTARYLGAGFTIAGKIYMGTGYNGGSLVDFWQYDPIAKVWSQMADFAGGSRQWAVGFSIGNKGYIGTGYNNNTSLNDFWEYDISNNWTLKAPFPGAKRFSATGFSIGNKGYIGTGYNGSVTYKDFWEYDPNNGLLGGWTRKADVGGAERDQAFGFSIGGKGYIGTGTFAGSGNYYKDFWEFNPATDSWIQKADFGGGKRVGGSAFSIGGKGFAGTGLDSINRKAKDFWEYTPSTDLWIRKADFGGTGRYFSTAFSVDNVGYIGTGFDGSPKKDFWLYNPDDSLNYLWSNGKQSPSIKVTTSGTYTVTVNNATLGCSATSLPIVVSVIGPITSTYTKTDATCNGVGNGSITVTPTSGTAPYTYRLGTVQPFVSSNTFTNLRSGKYTVSIRDAAGCAGITSQIIIGETTPLNASISKTDPTCIGAPDGSITVTPIVGTPPFQYKFRTTGIFQSVNTLTGLKAGIYRVYVKDANGCIVSISVLIIDPTNHCPAPPGFCQTSGTSTNCSSPTNVNVSFLSDGGAYLYGDAGSAVSFQIYIADQNYNKKRDTMIANIRANQQGYRVLRAFYPNGLYHWKIRALCGAPNTGYSDWICGPDFTIPTINGIVSSKQIQEWNTSSFDIIILPNPSNREFNLRIKTVMQDAVSIRVIDINGKSLYSTKGTPYQTYRFGESFAHGVYMIEVRQGDEVKTVKGIKLK